MSEREERGSVYITSQIGSRECDLAAFLKPKSPFLQISTQNFITRMWPKERDLDS